MIGTKIGQYEVAGKIGEGGMGEVYRARDSKLGRDVALEVLPAAFATNADRVARFDREARTLASLNHPNIAQIYGIEHPSADSGQGGVHALVMDRAVGHWAQDRLELCAEGRLADRAYAEAAHLADEDRASAAEREAASARLVLVPVGVGCGLLGMVVGVAAWAVAGAGS